ncbi:MAG TPA: hypothetical protein PKK59_03565 [Anaerolineaceae bacterium]|nr:hypothetical protein [Anaerolineaceae bacterium]
MNDTRAAVSVKQRARFNSQLGAAAGGNIKIIAISAGEGNGWYFSADVLRASLPLWEGVECFIDHDWKARSLRDLAGVCHDARWCHEHSGVKLSLRPVGPAAALLEEAAAAMFTRVEPCPRVGFSADLVFAADGRQVTRIEQVLSVDLVMHPARGGEFLSADVEPGLTREQEQLKLKEEYMENIEQNPGTQSDSSGEIHQQDAQVQMCACLLEASLAAAHLPPSAEDNLRARFNKRVFEAGALQQAITETRALISDLAAGSAIQGNGQVNIIATPEDQVNAALHDLLGASRPRELEQLHPARLSGIRELYTLMTGDTGFSGGYHRERAQFAATSNLPGLLKNAMNKLIVDQWQELGRSGYRWWEPVVQVEHFNSLQEITGVLVGEVTVLPSVSEGAAYTELAVKDSAETGAWGKYGGYVGLTLEMFERDETHKLRQYPRKLASAALRRISALVGAIFTSNSGVGPVMADTYNVFESAHHANLGTSALASASWEAAGKAIYNQPMAVASGGTAPKLALDARYLLVPRELRLTGMNILYPSFAHESSIFSENMQKGQMGDVITCPEFNDANDWAALADPRLAPGIILGERFGVLPEIIIADGETNGALFTNDEIRMKVRHWVSVFVADFRPLYKANVA